MHDSNFHIQVSNCEKASPVTIAQPKASLDFGRAKNYFFMNEYLHKFTSIFFNNTSYRE